MVEREGMGWGWLRRLGVGGWGRKYDWGGWGGDYDLYFIRWRKRIKDMSEGGFVF